MSFGAHQQYGESKNMTDDQVIHDIQLNLCLLLTYGNFSQILTRFVQDQIGLQISDYLK